MHGLSGKLLILMAALLPVLYIAPIHALPIGPETMAVQKIFS